MKVFLRGRTFDRGRCENGITKHGRGTDPCEEGYRWDYKDSAYEDYEGSEYGDEWSEDEEDEEEEEKAKVFWQTVPQFGRKCV